MIIDFEFREEKYSVDDEVLRGNDLIRGHILFYRRRLFAGSYRRPKYAGYEDYVVEIINESYGTNTGQHTFTLRVLMPFNASNSRSIGDKILVKGRNLYPYCLILVEPEDESERRSEKHERANYSKPMKYSANEYYDIYDDFSDFYDE